MDMVTKEVSEISSTFVPLPAFLYSSVVLLRLFFLYLSTLMFHSNPAILPLPVPIQAWLLLYNCYLAKCNIFTPKKPQCRVLHYSASVTIIASCGKWLWCRKYNNFSRLFELIIVMNNDTLFQYAFRYIQIIMPISIDIFHYKQFVKNTWMMAFTFSELTILVKKIP